MKPLIRVVEAEHVSEYKLRVHFNDGDVRTIDFSEWLRGAVFSPLRDVQEFKKFFLSGGTVCWPNGADIAPETLRGAEDVGASAA